MRAKEDLLAGLVAPRDGFSSERSRGGAETPVGSAPSHSEPAVAQCDAPSRGTQARLGTRQPLASSPP